MAQNKSLVDSWTISHVVLGGLSNLVGLSYLQYLAGAAAFELLEHSIESPKGSPLLGTKRPESPMNVAGDLIAGSTGYFIAQGILKK